MDMELRTKCEKAFEDFEQRLKALENKTQSIESKKSPTYHKPLDPNTFTYLVAENVTAVVGLREVIVSKHLIIRLAWILLFIVGAGATGYYVVKCCMEYSTDPTATQINLEGTEIFEFPSFKLCVNAWVNESQATAMGLSKELLEFSMGYLSVGEPNFAEEGARLRREFEAFYRKRNFTDLTDYYKSIAYNLDLEQYDGIGGIYFFCNTCDKKFGMKKTYVYQQGICYQFHLAAVNISSTPLELMEFAELKISWPKSAALPFVKSYFRLYVEAGNGSLYPPPFESVALELNKTNFATINRSTFQKIDNFRHHCTMKQDDSPFLCREFCINQQSFKEFRCRVLASSNLIYNISEYCNILDLNILMMMANSTPESTAQHEEEMKRCLKRCTPPCTGTLHQISVQSLQSELGQKDSNVSTCHVYLSDTSTRWQGVLQFQETFTYSFDSLIGNIGGTLGLFLGATVCTFFQLILTAAEFAMAKRR